MSGCLYVRISWLTRSISWLRRHGVHKGPLLGGSGDGRHVRGANARAVNTRRRRARAPVKPVALGTRPCGWAVGSGSEAPACGRAGGKEEVLRTCGERAAGSLALVLPAHGPVQCIATAAAHCYVRVGTPADGVCAIARVCGQGGTGGKGPGVLPVSQLAPTAPPPADSGSTPHRRSQRAGRSRKVLRPHPMTCAGID